MPRFLLLLVLLNSMAASAQKTIAISDSLRAHADRFEAKVRGSKAISIYPFGGYSVVQSSDEWETSTMLVFRLTTGRGTSEKRNARKSFSFTFTNGRGDTAWVLAKPQDRSLPERVITSSRQYEEAIQTASVFTAYIKTNRDTTTWLLLTQEKTNVWKGEKLSGYITNGATDIRIEKIEKMENGKGSILPFLGVELFEDGVSLGAVQFPTIFKPMVWLSKNLDDTRRFLLAAFAETLLIAQSEQYDESNIRPGG